MWIILKVLSMILKVNDHFIINFKIKWLEKRTPTQMVMLYVTL